MITPPNTTGAQVLSDDERFEAFFFGSFRNAGFTVGSRPVSSTNARHIWDAALSSREQSEAVASSRAEAGCVSSQGGKVHARNKEALAKARASAGASPATIAMQRYSASGASVVTRNAMVKRHGLKREDKLYAESAPGGRPGELINSDEARDQQP